MVANGGASALQIAEEYAGPIPLIVTDVIMPGLKGRQAAERIKASRSEVDILFISDYSSEAIAKHGVLEPGAKFLSKPFTQDALLARSGTCWTTAEAANQRLRRSAATSGGS